MDYHEREQAQKTMTFLRRLAGVLLLVFCLLAFALASQGKTMEDRDATGAALMFPVAVYLVFAKADYE